MIHLITEENSDLKFRNFTIPDGIRKQLKQTLDGYEGDKSIEGYERLNNILNSDALSYNEMRRIKNFFDNFKGTDKSPEFILNGGEPMKLWVDNMLNTATSTIRNYKQAKKDAGFKNAFRKPHEKDMQRKKGKPTIAKIKTNDVNNRIANDDSVRFECKFHDKNIIITENQHLDLISLIND